MINKSKRLNFSRGLRLNIHLTVLVIRRKIKRDKTQEWTNQHAKNDKFSLELCKCHQFLQKVFDI